MPTVNLAYAAKTTITLTLTSLTNTSARASTAIDNTSTKYIDALLRITSKGAAGSTGTVDLYVYTALSDTTYSDGATGTDAGFTAGNRKNSVFLGSLQMNTTTAVTSAVWSIAALFGGILPSKWGIIAINNSGGTLSATGGDHVVEFEGITQTVA